MSNPNYKQSKWRQLGSGGKATKGAVERHQRRGGCICKSVSHNTLLLSRTYYCDSCNTRIK